MNRWDSQQRNWNYKKRNQMGGGGMEILGLKGSIVKIKNSWNGLNNSSEMAEENSPCTWQITSNYQFEKPGRGGRLKKNEYRIRILWNSIRMSNTYVIGAPKDSENKAEKIFEDTKVKILLSLVKTLFTRSKKVIKLQKQ